MQSLNSFIESLTSFMLPIGIDKETILSLDLLNVLLSLRSVMLSKQFIKGPH